MASKTKFSQQPTWTDFFGGARSYSKIFNPGLTQVQTYCYFLFFSPNGKEESWPLGKFIAKNFLTYISIDFAYKPDFGPDIGPDFGSDLLCGQHRTGLRFGHRTSYVAALIEMGAAHPYFLTTRDRFVIREGLYLYRGLYRDRLV